MTDDDLFSELQRLVSVPRREPPEASVAALHRAVAHRFGPRSSWASWRHKIGLAAAAFGLVAGAPAAAFASGLTPLPDPLRTAMHSIGLPVDSVPVSDTRSAEAALQDALRRRDRAEELRAAARLRACLSYLDGTDRARMQSRADSLLGQVGQQGQVGPAATSAERARVPSGGEPATDRPEPGPGAVTGSPPSPTATGDGGNGSGEDGGTAPTGGTGTEQPDGSQPEATPGGATQGGATLGEPSGGTESPETTAPAAGPAPAPTTTVPDGTDPSGGDSSTGGSTDSAAAAATTTTTTTTTTVPGD